jgi:hypothetical protein
VSGWPVVTDHQPIQSYPFESYCQPGWPSVLANQARSLDWRSRQAEVIAHLPDEVTAKVGEAGGAGGLLSGKT